MFQSTRPRGARPPATIQKLIHVGFNPRAREGRDHAHVERRLFALCFNPRAREGRDKVCLVHSLPSLSFNPRANLLLGLVLCAVSIHAPARGATSHAAPRYQRDARFQSTRPRGARPHAHVVAKLATCFNPRAREGRDTQYLTAWVLSTSFNPRAREGRDRRRQSAHHARHRFNPRAREGRDSQIWSWSPSVAGFNPRAREGRDFCARERCARDRGFNPRARAGRPIRARPRGARARGFNPRAREGRHLRYPARSRRGKCFNPRAREGRDNTVVLQNEDAAVSIHAPARGATRRRSKMICLHRVFNPAARGGRARHFAMCRSGSSSFNPRAREGRDGNARPLTMSA